MSGILGEVHRRRHRRDDARFYRPWLSVAHHVKRRCACCHSLRRRLSLLFSKYLAPLRSVGTSRRPSTTRRGCIGTLKSRCSLRDGSRQRGTVWSAWTSRSSEQCRRRAGRALCRQGADATERPVANPAHATRRRTRDCLEVRRRAGSFRIQGRHGSRIQRLGDRGGWRCAHRDAHDSQTRCATGTVLPPHRTPARDIRAQPTRPKGGRVNLANPVLRWSANTRPPTVLLSPQRPPRRAA